MEASTKALKSIQSIEITMQLIKGFNYTCPGGWVAGSDSDNRANLSSTATEVGLPTGTELGKNT